MFESQLTVEVTRGDGWLDYIRLAEVANTFQVNKQAPNMQQICYSDNFTETGYFAHYICFSHQVHPMVLLSSHAINAISRTMIAQHNLHSQELTRAHKLAQLQTQPRATVDCTAAILSMAPYGNAAVCRSLIKSSRPRADMITELNGMDGVARLATSTGICAASGAKAVGCSATESNDDVKLSADSNVLGNLTCHHIIFNVVT